MDVSSQGPALSLFDATLPSHVAVTRCAASWTESKATITKCLVSIEVRLHDTMPLSPTIEEITGSYAKITAEPTSRPFLTPTDKDIYKCCID